MIANSASDCAILQLAQSVGFRHIKFAESESDTYTTQNCDIVNFETLRYSELRTLRYVAFELELRDTVNFENFEKYIYIGQCN